MMRFLTKGSGRGRRKLRVVIPAVLFAIGTACGLSQASAAKVKLCKPLSQQYWLANPDLWPLTTVTLGTVTYTKAQALAIMTTAQTTGWAKDASLNLGNKMIGALLDIANGTDGSLIAATIADANTLLGTGTIPEGIKPSTPLGIQMTADATVFGRFNKGYITNKCGGAPPPVGSCQPSSSLSAMAIGTNVTSYVPKGAWEGGPTGLSVINVEGSSITPTAIATPNTVNSCASNSTTGVTVCTANNTDVYLLTGTTLNSTLTSGGSGSIGFSGGSCTNCGVAMDAVNNKALIGLSIASAPGFQILDLASSTLATPYASAAGIISEDPLVIPVPPTGKSYPSGATLPLILSASESNNYEIVANGESTTPAFFENSIAGSGEADSSGADCQTGIALAPYEFTSNVFIADLTQATFTPGSPGTWSTTASQIQTLTEASLSAGASGIAVAQGTHTGIVSGEFGGDAITAIALPTTSGSGTPAITDWVTCSIGGGFSNGLDPHTVTAYQSPNGSKDAFALLANGGASTVARVDLTQMLNTTTVPRTAGGHACAAGVLPATVVNFISVP